MADGEQPGKLRLGGPSLDEVGGMVIAALDVDDEESSAPSPGGPRVAAPWNVFLAAIYHRDMSDDEPVEESDRGDEESDGFGAALAIPIIGVSIPLVAVSIPLVAVLGASGLGAIVFGIGGAVLVVLAIGWVVRSLMNHRHELRVKELELQLRIARQETEKLAEVNRVLEPPDLFRDDSGS